MPGQILTSIPSHFETQFSDNWEFLLQQKDSRFENLVRHYTVKGKERRISYLGALSMRPVVTRNGRTIPQDSPMAARWLRVRGFDAVTWIDEWDEISLGELPAPESEHVMAHAMAAKRQKDDIIISAFSDDAYVGDNGTDAVAVPSTQKVAVNYVRTGSAVNSGLTLAKLIRAKYLMDTAEVPTEGRYLAISAVQEADLLADVDQVSNSRYSDVHALVNGEVPGFLGFKFVRSQRLTLDTVTDIRICPAWQKDGVAYGDAQQPKARIDILPTQNHTIQIRTTLVAGATRTEEVRVVLIYCDQSP
jgi:hypothetical protein